MNGLEQSRNAARSSWALTRRGFLLETSAAAAWAALFRGSRSARAESQTPSPDAIWSRHYWAQRGDIKLFLLRKNMGPAPQGNSTRPIVFFCHGSSVSARSTFDLKVPGHGEYSLMDTFVRYGFDVWAMDFEGYGSSSPSAGNSNVRDGAEDLKAAARVVERETGQRSFHLYGESGGALRAAAFAVAQPASVRRLVMVGFVYTGKGSPTLTRRAEQLDYYRTHNRRPRDRKAILSIFTRDKPGTSDPAVGQAMADAELRFGDTVPTGTYLDMTAHLPVINPTQLRVPVLIVRGEYDGIATEQDLLDFFRQLPLADREFVVLPGAAHSVALGLNRRQFWHVMHAFLDMPPRADPGARAAAAGA